MHQLLSTTTITQPKTTQLLLHLLLFYLYAAMYVANVESLIACYVPLDPGFLFWVQFHLVLCLVKNRGLFTLRVNLLRVFSLILFTLTTLCHFPVSLIDFHPSSYHYTPWGRYLFLLLSGHTMIYLATIFFKTVFLALGLSHWLCTQ